MKLVHRVEPGAVGNHVHLLTRILIQHIERLVKVRTEPDEVVANLGVQMVTVRGNFRSLMVIDD